MHEKYGPKLTFVKFAAPAKPPLCNKCSRLNLSPRDMMTAVLSARLAFHSCFFPLGFMHPYARLSPGPGFAPIRAALYYSQRMVVNPIVRGAVARSIGSIINQIHGRPLSPRVWDETTPPLIELRRQGIARLPNLLPATDLDEVVAYLQHKNVVTTLDKRASLDAASSMPDALAAYPLETVLESPHVRWLANSPYISALAERYLGCVPTISSIGIRWSFPKKRAPDVTQMFHRDVDDWRFLKVFIYLTDVDHDSGPHQYVRGTHRKRSRFRARPYTSKEIKERHGEGSIETVTGPKGTSFAADTFGIHCGMPPNERPRLILQVQYSVLPIFAFKYEPIKSRFPAPPSNYTNRLLLR